MNWQRDVASTSFLSFTFAGYPLGSYRATKRRRSEQFKEGADLSQGAYIDVRDQDKTQARQRNATLMRVERYGVRYK